MRLCDGRNGTHPCTQAAHIIVYDRVSKRLTEEKISPHLVLAMRNMYQTRVSGKKSGSPLARMMCQGTGEGADIQGLGFRV